MHSTLYNWYLPVGRLPPPGSSSPSFVVRKHFGCGGFEGRVWWPLRCLLCHNFPHLHLHKKNCVIHKNKNVCLPSQLRVVILPKPSSSNCETKEDITTGVSTEVRSSWDPAAWPQRHSIDQGGLFYALPRCPGIQVPEVHSARLRVSFTAHQLYSRIRLHLEAQMSKDSSRAWCTLQKAQTWMESAWVLADGIIRARQRTDPNN